MNNWQNNTYVLLSDLHDDHEVALVENSLRDSEFYYLGCGFNHLIGKVLLGVYDDCSGYWQYEEDGMLITRTQALKLAGVEV